MVEGLQRNKAEVQKSYQSVRKTTNTYELVAVGSYRSNFSQFHFAWFQNCIRREWCSQRCSNDACATLRESNGRSITDCKNIFKTKIINEGVEGKHNRNLQLVVNPHLGHMLLAKKIAEFLERNWLLCNQGFPRLFYHKGAVTEIYILSARSQWPCAEMDVSRGNNIVCCLQNARVLNKAIVNFFRNWSTNFPPANYQVRQNRPYCHTGKI